jgi:AraC-like DNA-binding protein
MASTVFSLDDTPVNQRFSHFREVVESFYIPIGLECEYPERFNAWVTGSELGEVSVGTCFLAEQRVSRKPEHIARSEDDRIKLILPLSGAIASHQDGNDVVVRRGEFYITDPTRPYEEQILEDLTFIYLLLPRNHVVSKIDQIEKVTATSFACEQPYARLASDFAHSLSAVGPALEGSKAVQAASVVTDLFTMVLWEHMSQVRTHSTVYRSTLFRRAKAFIDEHLTEPDLSLAKVAAAMGVSSRYLSDLFSEAAFNYRPYVLEQRLLRCAQNLTDPRLAYLAIAEIALQCGFSDNAHFSRAFKAAYGISPREYRACHKI